MILDSDILYHTQNRTDEIAGQMRAWSTHWSLIDHIPLIADICGHIRALSMATIYNSADNIITERALARIDEVFATDCDYNSDSDHIWIYGVHKIIDDPNWQLAAMWKSSSGDIKIWDEKGEREQVVDYKLVRWIAANYVTLEVSLEDYLEFHLVIDQ